MQKKLIVAAVISALSPAVMANPTLYGGIHMSVDNVSVVDNTNTAQSNLFASSNSSYLGVKGSEELDEYGLKLLYRLETGIRSVGVVNDGNPGSDVTTGLFSGMRTSYIGVKGEAGTFMAGYLPFGEQFAHDANLFADQVGDTANILGINESIRYVTGVRYATPNLNGLKASFVATPKFSLGQNQNIDTAYSLKASYDFMGARVSAIYLTMKGAIINPNPIPPTNIQYSPLSISGSYDFGMGMLAAQWVRHSTTVNNVNNTQDIYSLGGKYNVLPNAAVKLQYTLAKDDSNLQNGDNGGKQIAVGFDYHLSEKTNVYVAYSQVNNNLNAHFIPNGYGHGNNLPNIGTPQNPQFTADGSSPSALSLGIIHNF